MNTLHRIIRIEHYAFGLKYKSEHWHGLLSRTRPAIQSNPELRDHRPSGITLISSIAKVGGKHLGERQEKVGSIWETTTVHYSCTCL